MSDPTSTRKPTERFKITKKKSTSESTNTNDNNNNNNDSNPFGVNLRKTSASHPNLPEDPPSSNEISGTGYSDSQDNDPPKQSTSQNPQQNTQQMMSTEISGTGYSDSQDNDPPKQPTPSQPNTQQMMPTEISGTGYSDSQDNDPPKQSTPSQPNTQQMMSTEISGTGYSDSQDNDPPKQPASSQPNTQQEILLEPSRPVRLNSPPPAQPFRESLKTTSELSSGYTDTQEIENEIHSTHHEEIQEARSSHNRSPASMDSNHDKYLFSSLRNSIDNIRKNSGSSESSIALDFLENTASKKFLALSASSNLGEFRVGRDAFDTSKETLEKKYKDSLSYEYLENNMWNEGFQKVIRMKADTPSEVLTRVVELRNLSRQFVEIATQIGKEIIEEYDLPQEKRKFQPKNVLDTKDLGAKYIEKSILFKFATDSAGIYGDDEFAMKACSHELAGANAFLKVILEQKLQDFFVPLMCIIDYRGYRMLASAVVPVKAKETLVYGSCDFAKTVKKSDPVIDEKMQAVAKQLQLKGHLVGASRTLLHFGGDIEGHIGTDKMRYVLDTNRVFPPESLSKVHLFFPANLQDAVEEIDFPEDISDRELENEIQILLGCPRDLINARKTPFGFFYYNKGQVAVKNERANIVLSNNDDDDELIEEITGDAILIRSLRSSYFHKLLRPELLNHKKRPKVALSSDAFTGYQSQDDPDKDIHQREVNEATRFLLKTVIPLFADNLNKHLYTPVDHKDLVRLMHCKGINVRYLGVLRAYITPTSPHLRSFILTEMIVRVCKNMLRARMRKKRLSGEADYNQVGLDFFNTVLGAPTENILSDDFWRYTLKVNLQLKFPSALSEKERQAGSSLRDEILPFPLFTRMQEVTGFYFKPGAQKNLFEYPLFFMKEFPLVRGDVDTMKCLTKTMISDQQVKGAILESVTAEEGDEQKKKLKALEDKEIQRSYKVLFQLKIHRRLERILGSDSSEAIKSYFTLANLYKSLGRTDLALDCGLRGLSYGEVLFGDYSEETLVGLVTVGEIMESFPESHWKQRAIGFYKRALTSVDRLYRIHPLKGKLGCKLHFLEEDLTPESGQNLNYLEKGFEAYSQMYGEESATLVVPLLALENNVGNFVSKILSQTEVDIPEKNLQTLAEDFWPEHILSSIKTYKAKKDIYDILDKLRHLRAYDILFGDNDGKNELEALLELSEDDYNTISEIQRGAFRRFYPAISRYSREMNTNQTKVDISPEELPPELISSKDIWNAHSLPFSDFFQFHFRTLFSPDRPAFLSKDTKATAGLVEHKARLRHRLDEFDLRRAYNIAPDASSQFCAISHQLFGVTDKAIQLRQIAVRWLRENPHYELSRGISLQTVSDQSRRYYYLKQIEDQNAAGDLFTLAALAEKFGLIVYIISSNERSKFATVFRPKGVPVERQRPIFLSHYANLLWGSLRSVDKPFTPVDFSNSENENQSQTMRVIEQEMTQPSISSPPINLQNSTSSTLWGRESALPRIEPRLKESPTLLNSSQNITSQDSISPRNRVHFPETLPESSKSGRTSFSKKTGIRISKFGLGRKN